MIKDNVLITGCSSGLGVFLAEKFESMGHKVIKHNGRKHFDLNNIEDIKSLVELSVDNDVKLLINNAAIGCPSKKLEDYDIEEINSMINVNLRAPIILVFLLSKYLNNIININSMVGLEIKKNRTLYSATKWGLRGFSNSYELEQENIQTLDIYPTNIKTTPERKNAMDANWVVDEIYKAYIKGETSLILDGRNK